MIDAAPYRRTLLTGMVLAPWFALPGCASLTGFSLTSAIRELLTLSSQRAFARLIQQDGFFDSQVARIELPSQLGGAGASSLLSRVLLSTVFKDRLQRQVNRAAEKGAERAAPLVADTIRSISIADAAAIVRGGPTAATDMLENAMGDSLIEAMFPAIGDGLRLFDSGVVTEALRVATGIDVTGLTRDISTKATRGIYRAIGREEAAIRVNPRETGSPVLIGVFGIGG